VAGGKRVFRGVAVLALCASGCDRPPSPPPMPDAARAFGHLQAQVDCGPRVPGTPGAACGRRLILEHLARFASRVTTQEFSLPDPYGTDSLRLVNLQASFYVGRAKRILLGAHYDSRPRADQDSGSARELPIAGANDGASGVAVLLELAQLLGGWDPGIGVDLVFFDGEDYGREGDLDHYLLGSRYFVRNRGAYHPQAMILVDMVGKRDLRIPVEQYSQRLAPQLVDLVFSVADSLGVRSFVREPGRPVVDDHVPFLQAGIPALDLIDLDDPAWHTQADLPDHCSPQSLADVTTVLVHSLARLGAR
jgi:Peptidase family M28